MRSWVKYAVCAGIAGAAAAYVAPKVLGPYERPDAEPVSVLADGSYASRKSWEVKGLRKLEFNTINLLHVVNTASGTVEEILKENGLEEIDYRPGQYESSMYRLKERESFVWENIENIRERILERLDGDEKIAFDWFAYTKDVRIGKNLFPYVSPDREMCLSGDDHGVSIKRRVPLKDSSGYWEWKEVERINCPVRTNRLVWSQKGDRIAFVGAEGDLISDIWIATSDGIGPVNLTDSIETFEDFPFFAPDGRIIYSAVTFEHLIPVADKIRRLHEKYKDVKLAGERKKEINQMFDELIDWDKFSDVQREGRYDIWIMDQDGKNKRCLTEGLDIPNGPIVFPMCVSEGIIFRVVGDNVLVLDIYLLELEK